MQPFGGIKKCNNLAAARRVISVSKYQYSGSLLLNCDLKLLSMRTCSLGRFTVEDLSMVNHPKLLLKQLYLLVNSSTFLLKFSRLEGSKIVNKQIKANNLV